MGYYNSISSGYDKLHSKEQIAKINIIVSNLKLSPKDILLDVGCGTGIAKNYFKCNYVGIDISKGMLGQFSGSKVLGTGDLLPFFNKCFDIVVSITSLHNIKNYENALIEMKRVSKGRVVISLLKKSKNFKKIVNIIEKLFKVEKIIEEDIDKIYFLKV